MANLFIQELIHGVFALPFAYLLWMKTGSLKKALLVEVFTYLIDLDHLWDYFAFYGAKFNLIDFLNAEYFKITHRAFVPLHAWEWGLILTGIALVRGWKSVSTLMLFSLLPHLIYDSITVGSITFYSIIYRISKNFVNLN